MFLPLLRQFKFAIAALFVIIATSSSAQTTFTLNADAEMSFP